MVSTFLHNALFRGLCSYMAIVVVIKDTQNARMYGQEVKLMQKYNQNHLYNKTLRPDGDFSVMSASFSLSLNDKMVMPQYSRK